ncbi:hypothetical protein ACX83E_00095 [Burkholderia pseudomallei]
MSMLAHVFLPAALGAAMQETVYWWQLRFKLNQKKYRDQMRSPIYWALVLVMIFGSATGTVFWFGDHAGVARDYLVFGAAFPLIFKHAADAASDARRKLGPKSETRWGIVETYLQMR